MSKIAPLLDQLASKISHADTINGNVSKVNVAWHIDHCLRVINNVIIALENSDANNYKPAINLKRSYFLILRYIPRGRIRAPKTVRPPEEFTVSDIEKQLETARSLVSKMETMDKKSNFMHPFVGQMNLKHAIDFLQIHTKHHLKIIDDIIKND